jgi:hypothetical protein
MCAMQATTETLVKVALWRASVQSDGRDRIGKKGQQ